MDQLFKALPRDLQWHILTEFVGSHSVRKGKLIKKMVFGSKHKLVQHIYTSKRWRMDFSNHDSVILPPFEKHSYSSYEDTEKKKRARGVLKKIETYA